MYRDDIYLEEIFSHYFALKEQRTVAFYLRAKSIPVDFNPKSPLSELWKQHTQYKDLVFDNSDYKQLPESQKSLLDLKYTIANRMLEKCEFCERKCGINRKQAINRKIGFCGQSEKTYISSAFLHWGEERPLVPSGTIFFNGCPFDCVFCQNFDIATAGKKKRNHTNFGSHLVTPKILAQIALDLEHQGAQNINYVGGDPTPHLHTILESMKFQESNICQLWNSNFYLSSHTLSLLLGVIDLWLPDFKYGNNECAFLYSKAPDYWEVITRNFLKIYQEGSKNIIIRHLVMPNHIECCSKPILRWIADNIPKIAVNIMAQYHPDYLVSKDDYPEINRRVSSKEMQEVYEFADQLKIKYQGF
ncbi:MAG: radical SAM protein [Promethearchaeota archaeon]